MKITIYKSYTIKTVGGLRYIYSPKDIKDAKHLHTYLAVAEAQSVSAAKRWIDSQIGLIS